MEIMTIPILCGELPKFLGAICYEGDKNVKRLEFTGAEPGLQYKLDMERTDGVKNVVDLVNQNGTLVLTMDGSVHIPAGRYQVQLRTIGDIVKHTNKAFLTVRDSIDAVNAFDAAVPTEMQQMEQRITDAMHRSEKAAAEAEGAVVNAEKSATEAKTAAESVNSEVFIAEYGVTTYDEINQAYISGKVVFCRGSIYDNSPTLPLVLHADGIALFSITGYAAGDNKLYTFSVEVDRNGKWTYSSLDGEPGTFTAEYGVTTHKDIMQAWDSGKVVFCKYGDCQFPLVMVDDNEAVFSLSVTLGSVNEFVAGTITVNKDNHWEDSEQSRGPGIFIAEYGVTSLGEIGEAWNAGKAIFCNYNNKYRVPLYAKTDSMAVFYAVSNDSGIYLRRTKSAWSNTTIKHPVAHTHTMDDIVLTEEDKEKIKEELKKYIYEEILGS